MGFQLIIHMVSSLDGYIAKKDNSVSWFETTDNYDAGEEMDHGEDYFKHIDCFLMGSHTYEHAEELSKDHGWVYGDVPSIVVSSRPLVSFRKNVEFYSGELTTLVEERLKPHFKTVWMVGGPTLAKSIIDLKLATSIQQTILPILLGEGKLFYDALNNEQPLHLNSSKTYKNGMVELCYDLL